mgnify:CR=1 FL=1
MDRLERDAARVYRMGGDEKIARQHGAGRYTARERIEKLLDPDSFFELGRFAHSDLPEAAQKTPADSKISGFGNILGRRVAVSANDFTVLAATTARVSGRKEAELKSYAHAKGYPLVYLGEAGGARMPDIMGSKGLASFGGGGFATYTSVMSRTRRSPMVTAILGECYGMPTWMACLSDFVVQVRGTAMGVSGPRVLKMALGETVSDEELGGVSVHSGITGCIDAVAENEDHCFDHIRRFLSYLPSNSDALPPVYAVPEGSGSDMPRILDLLPEQRNRTYDMTRILSCIVDRDSLYEIKPGFGRSVITALARINGKSVGIVASQPLYLAGAMDCDGIDKVTGFLCLCDSFNVPLIFCHDTPGFLVGKDAEHNRVGARVMNFMNALGQVTVPKIAVIMRKSFGMAFWNMGGSGCATDFIVAWPMAEMSFVDPVVAANVVYGGKTVSSQERERLTRRFVDDASPFGAAGAYHIHDVIDPATTRDYIITALDIAQNGSHLSLGSHNLANWPTKF